MLRLMVNSWFVSIELHTLPGGVRTLPSAGEIVTASSAAALQAARQFGLRTAVVVTDRAFYGHAFDHLVDAWLVTDTSSAVNVNQALTTLNGDVTAVTSSVDSFVRVAAEVSRIRHLLGPNPDGPGIRRDKSTARQALAAAGIPDIRWGVQDATDENLTSPIGYPAVVKPVDGAASWDVSLVINDHDARALAARHLGRTTYGRGVTPRRRLIFEQVLEGPVYSAEGLVDAEGVTVFGYSDRVMTPPPYFVELAVRFSTERPYPDADRYVADCLRALGYDFGPFHLEFVATPDGPRLLELNARLVGSGNQYAISRLAGTAPAAVLVAKLARQPPPTLQFTGAVTELRLTVDQTGQLMQYQGLDEAVRSPGCHAAGLYVAIGDQVSHEVASNSQLVGYVQAIGLDREDSYRKAATAAQRIKLHIEPDGNLLDNARCDRRIGFGSSLYSQPDPALVAQSGRDELKEYNAEDR